MERTETVELRQDATAAAIDAGQPRPGLAGTLDAIADARGTDAVVLDFLAWIAERLRSAGQEQSNRVIGLLCQAVLVLSGRVDRVS